MFVVRACDVTQFFDPSIAFPPQITNARPLVSVPLPHIIDLHFGKPLSGIVKAPFVPFNIHIHHHLRRVDQVRVRTVEITTIDS